MKALSQHHLAGDRDGAFFILIGIAMSELTILPENWETIREYEKRAKEQFETDKLGLNLDRFFLSGVEQISVPLYYRKRKKDGSHTQKSFKIDTVAKFCPFTGKPLYKEVTQSTEIS